MEAKTKIDSLQLQVERLINDKLNDQQRPLIQGELLLWMSHITYKRRILIWLNWSSF